MRGKEIRTRHQVAKTRPAHLEQAKKLEARA
jgi:hypothetical protein